MIALGFIYLVFTSHLSYIVLEKREDFYKERMFWIIVIGLLASIYLTLKLFRFV